MTKKIGILNGGGDCPGLNAVIATVVKYGTTRGYEFVGFERGWEGVLDPLMYRELDLESVKGISFLGGTILKTTNKGRFAAKIGEGDLNKIPEKVLVQAKANLEKLDIDGLIVIGGDGTLSGAVQLADLGVKIIGIPKTIDNDIDATDRSFGYSTSVDVVVDALDKIHTTATSHERTFIVECMGRHTGWIALAAGLAGGANAILLPEFPFSIDDLIEHMRSRLQDQKRSTIILIAEGAKIDGQAEFHSRAAKEVRYSGVSKLLMNEIEARTSGEFELRNTVLGHVQRGGNPNAADRTLSKRYGVAAMEAYEAEQFGHMVRLQNNVMSTCAISEAVAALKQVSESSPEYYVSKKLGIFIQ